MSGSFEQRYRAVAEELLSEVGSDCGLADEDIVSTEKRLGAKIPKALREYLSTVGNLELNTAHNRLLPLNEWFVDDAKLVFMEESQRVVFWAVDASEIPGDDPRVLQGVNRLPERIEWYPEQDSTSDFLVLMLHFQAAMGGYDRILSADVDPKALAYFESEWNLGGESNGLLAFRRRGEVACFIGSRTDVSLQMFAGAVSHEAYDRLSTTLQKLEIEYDEL